jgi:hypothetical protein
MVQTCDADGVDPGFDACLFHPYRMGRGRPSVKTIRKFCLECMGNTPSFVRECDTADCNCYSYRMGKNPAMTGKGYFADQARKKKADKGHVQGGFAVKFERSALG